MEKYTIDIIKAVGKPSVCPTSFHHPPGSHLPKLKSKYEKK